MHCNLKMHPTINPIDPRKHLLSHHSLPSWALQQRRRNTPVISPLPWKAATLREIRNLRPELDIWIRFWMSLRAANWYFSSIFLVQQVRFLDTHTWRSEPEKESNVAILKHCVGVDNKIGQSSEAEWLEVQLTVRILNLLPHLYFIWQT